MSKTVNKHVYPIIDIMVERAVSEVVEAGDTISCQKGCSHCCHLLIEVVWDEALELAHWIASQPQDKKEQLIASVQNNAQIAKKIFKKRKSTCRFMAPVDDDSEIPESVFETYFYDNHIPCPFLKDNACSVYEVRPSPCRLHLVTSPSENCSRTLAEAGVETPEIIEEIRDDLSPVLQAVSEDPRWGQMGVMVEAALEEIGEITSSAKVKIAVEEVA